MTTTIVVVADTHCATWEEVHPEIRTAVADADIAVHCGDFTRQSVVDGFSQTARRAVLVHGNTDPPDIRRALPYVQVLEVEGTRIGVTHPAWGGPEFGPADLLPDFPEPVDVILFGHLHETMDQEVNGVRFINPGQAYASFLVPATMAMVTMSARTVSSEIRLVQPGL